MMKPTVFLVVALVLALPAASRIDAQAHPNFSGTWKVAKQEPPATAGRGGQAGGPDERGGTKALEVTPVTVVIAQNGNDLTFESHMSDGWVRKLQFKLDFTYAVNPIAPGDDGGEPRINGPTKTRGRWLDGKLYLHLTQGLGQRRDILTMSGNVLTIRRDYETPGGSGTMHLTLNKVS